MEPILVVTRQEAEQEYWEQGKDFLYPEEVFRERIKQTNEEGLKAKGE